MIVIDAGPLVALQDRDDADHHLCRVTFGHLTPPFLTTWAVFAEAIHLLGARSGWFGQDRLWKLMLAGGFQLAELEHSNLPRVYKLMEKYADVPMDLADATLVCLSEVLQNRKVFTLDNDFRVYRLHGKKEFEVIP